MSNQYLAGSGGGDVDPASITIGSEPTWLINDGSETLWFDMAKHSIIFDDFIVEPSNSEIGWHGFSRQVGGGGSIEWSGTGANPGIVKLDVNGNVTRSGITTGESSFNLGAGRMRFSFICKLNQLSNGTDSYKAYIGLGDRNQTAAFNAIWFTYKHNENSGNWICDTNGFSGGPDINTSVAADTDWHKYTIDIAANGLSVSFFIDDVEVTGSPLTLPVNTNDMGIALHVESDINSGSLGEIMQIDAVQTFINLSSNRY